MGAGVGAVLDVPGIDVSLAAIVERSAVGGQPAEELCRLLTWSAKPRRLLAVSGLRSARARSRGSTSQVANRRISLACPASVMPATCSISHRSNRQICLSTTGSTPQAISSSRKVRRQGVKRRVGQLDLAAAEFGQQVRRCPVAALARMQPGQTGQRVVHREQVRRHDQTYESLARNGATMTAPAMATYAYDQIDQARTELNAVSK